MYHNVIKKSLNYTRPLLISRLYYEKKQVTNEISTMIVLNKKGDILTTAKNADIFLTCNEYNEIYPPILKEINESKNKSKIEKKYGITNETIVGMHNIIIDISSNPGDLKIIKHPYLDLAIISLQNKDGILVDKFPKFALKTPEVGTSLCSVGFAFPEYKAFKYDEELYQITSNFQFMNFPIFPTDGIMCRNIADKEDKVTMFEMSNRIVTGQEGGPIFNQKSQLVGMITGYRNIYDKSGNIKLGIGINNTTIMKFLDDNNIEYEVENEKEK